MSGKKARNVSCDQLPTQVLSGLLLQSSCVDPRKEDDVFFIGLSRRCRHIPPRPLTSPLTADGPLFSSFNSSEFSRDEAVIVQKILPNEMRLFRPLCFCTIGAAWERCLVKDDRWRRRMLLRIIMITGTWLQLEQMTIVVTTMLRALNRRMRSDELTHLYPLCFLVKGLWTWTRPFSVWYHCATTRTVCPSEMLLRKLLWGCSLDVVYYCSEMCRECRWAATLYEA